MKSLLISLLLVVQTGTTVIEQDTSTNMESVVASIPEGKLYEVDKIWLFKNNYKIREATLLGNKWEEGQFFKEEFASVNRATLINNVYNYMMEYPFLYYDDTWGPHIWVYSDNDKKYLKKTLDDQEIKNQYITFIKEPVPVEFLTLEQKLQKINKLSDRHTFLIGLIKEGGNLKVRYFVHCLYSDNHYTNSMVSYRDNEIGPDPDSPKYRCSMWFGSTVEEAVNSCYDFIYTDGFHKNSKIYFRFLETDSKNWIWKEVNE